TLISFSESDAFRSEPVRAALQVTAEPSVLVIGAGAIGSIVAAHLDRSAAVAVVEEWDHHADAIRSGRLEISGVRAPRRVRLPVLAPAEVPEQAPFDLVLIAVKAPRNELAFALAEQACGPASTAVSLQNGVHEDSLAERLGAERVVGAVTEIGGY